MFRATKILQQNECKCAEKLSNPPENGVKALIEIRDSEYIRALTMQIIQKSEVDDILDDNDAVFLGGHIFWTG